jgi:hypothetical protein
VKNVEDSMQGYNVPDISAADLLHSRDQELQAASSGSSGSSAGAGAGRGSQFPRFSMATGDFVEIYTNLKSCDPDADRDPGAEQWDAVVTCFFIDTAPVVLE